VCNNYLERSIENDGWKRVDQKWATSADIDACVIHNCSSGKSEMNTLEGGRETRELRITLPRSGNTGPRNEADLDLSGCTAFFLAGLALKFQLLARATIRKYSIKVRKVFLTITDMIQHGRL